MLPPEMVNLFLQVPLVGIVVWVMIHLNKEAQRERDTWRQEISEMQRAWRNEITSWRKDSQENIIRLEQAIKSNTEVMAQTLRALDKVIDG